MKTSIKDIIMIPLLTVCSVAASAQIGFSGGLAGGVSTGSVKISNVGNGFTDVIEGKNIYGFEAGIYAKLRLAPFYIRPQLMYDFRKGDVTYNDNTNGSQTSNFTMHKIELPVFFGLHLIGPVAIEAAPVYNYIVSVTDRYDTYDVTVGKNGIGWRAGVNVDLGAVFLNATYQGVTYSSSDNKATFKEPYKLTFGLGIRLGGAADEE